MTVMASSIPEADEVLAAFAEHPQLGKLAEADVRELARYLEHLRVPAGEVLIREGARDQELYLVVDGRLRTVRGDLDLGGVEAGQQVGELALLLAHPRAASVVSETDATVLRLTAASFVRLREAAPQLAFRVVQALVGVLAERLAGMTDNVGLLLRGRSLPRRTHVRLRFNGDRSSRDVPTGSALANVIPEEVDGHPVVAGLIDQRAHSLTTPLTSEGRVKPLTTASWEGRRIYRRSLGLLALEAARDVAPDLRPRLGQSLGVAQRVITNGYPVAELPTLAKRVAHRMRELSRLDAPLREELWTTGEARAHLSAERRELAADLLTTWRAATVPLSTYGDVYAVAAGPLAARSGILRGFDVVAGESGMLLVYGPHGTQSWGGDATTEETLASKAIDFSARTAAVSSEHRRWIDALAIHSVGELNRRCISGDVGELIHVAEGYQEKRLSQIADRITARRGAVKLVCIAGPSSSGKTTFIKRLRVQLQVNGVTPRMLSLDDYYVDREETPRDADGEYDYEAFDALRADLLAADLASLLAGESTRTAHFDFLSGKSDPDGGKELSLGPNEVLLIEGIHALNPGLLPAAARDAVFRVFVCPVAQLPLDDLTPFHPADSRLLRRIVRDRHNRGYRAAETIARWPSVRRGERRHIFPFEYLADAVFDSSLVYEPCVVKVYAERYLMEVPDDHPSATTAYRLLEILDRYVTIYPKHVPPTSILREFIGGSDFLY